MSLSSQRSGNTFKKAKHGGHTLSPEEMAALMIFAGFPAKTQKDLQVIAEGVATVEGESGFDPTARDYVSGTHIGLWQEEPGWGTEAERLDPLKSTILAYKHWKADGGFQQEWGQYDGEAWRNWKRHKKAAENAAVKVATMQPSGGGPQGLVEDAAGAIDNAGDFLTEMASTLLDFRRLGQLFAEAVAWFIRLILKAIWDYVIAPLFHWAERAVSWYWVNFFGTGTERGSGLGYILRQNAGIITIIFWALGYAILWSDGTSPTPTAAHNTVLGRGIKGVEGLVARRNLINPSKVQDKTPNKPKVKATTVPITRTSELAVTRKRPVSVSGPGITMGRKPDVSSQRSGSHRVARPGSSATQSGEGSQTAQRQSKKIILPPSAQTEKDTAAAVS